MRLKAYMVAFSALLMMSSCGEPPVLDELVVLDANGWHMDSVVEANWSPKDSAKPVFMRMYVRHTDEYPYSNLYLFRSIYSSEGKEFSDTVNVQLADALGKWNGSGMSNLKTMDIPIGRGAVRFVPNERYRLVIQHGMRDTVISGVQDIGVVFEYAE
jgi:gliding motility-associated lipoprotein GldH